VREFQLMSAPIQIQHFALKDVRIPFKTAFRHAAAERAETSTLWIEAVSPRGAIGYGESCPRPYVTGETLDTAREFFWRHEEALREQVVDLDSLKVWMKAHADKLDANPAAWCAIELAILDVFAREHGRTVEALLSLLPLRGPFRYSAVLGDASFDAFQATAEQYRRVGFTDFKIKLSGQLEHDRRKLDLLRNWGAPAPRIRLDANNLWSTAAEATAFLRQLDCAFVAVEEPIQKGQYAELARIAEALACKVILDESFIRSAQLPLLPDPAGQWLINVRVSKMGGLLRSLEVIREARTRDIGVIVGAQVGETSLLTRAALPVAQEAGDRLVAQEGAFGTFLLERDVCNPPLMFGAEGQLDISAYPWLTSPGFGLRCDVA
jgi:L-alanine-DL-glutamate epimerase-like enolase superfamily enzyme